MSWMLWRPAGRLIGQKNTIFYRNIVMESQAIKHTDDD
jgi:stress response protein SCP2